MKVTNDLYGEQLQKASWLMLGAWAGLALFLPWQWSVLMDEVSFLHTLTAGSFWGTAQREFEGYLTSGRFYPVKMLINVAEWRWLPHSPALFHRLHFFVALLTLGLGWAALRARAGIARLSLRREDAIFFFASAVLAKPILDSVQFLSIGETWAAFFLALGLFLYVRSWLWSARLVWVLAAWSKEPMAGVFACSILYQLSVWREASGARGKKLFFVALDLALFLSLATMAYLAMKQGIYLADYSVFTLAGVKSWVYSLVRLGFFMSPLVLFASFGLWRSPGLIRELWSSPRERSWILFLASFVAGYLFLVSPRGASGYLQVPIALAALLLLFPFARRGVECMQGVWTGTAALATVFWLGMGAFSLAQWTSSVQGMNEVSLVFPELVRSPSPRLVLVHGAEVSEILKQMAKREGWDQVRVVDAETFDPTAHSDFTGEVILLDPVRYFGDLPATVQDKIQAWAGGWRKVSADSPSYRAYFGLKSRP